MLVPADLAVFVLFFQPAHQRFEVFHHRAGGDIFAGSLLQHFAPIFGAAFFQNVVEPRTHFLLAERIGDSARSTCDKRSRVADVYRRATKTQSRQSALVCQLGEPVPRFRARNCATRSSGKRGRRPRPMRKRTAESGVAKRNGKLALNAMTPAIPTPRLANPTSA